MSETDRKNLTILIVEDNEDTRYLMRLGLEELGYRVCEAEDGEQAIDMAWREKPNAILMDISMPVLNGLTATARIRELDGLSTIPIVAVTAHHEVELRDGAQACGFTAYVTKPIDFQWLDELLKNLIG
jgi:CheY-like chemotaxis protein